MPVLRYFLLLVLTTCCCAAYAQQDVDFHIDGTYLAGKNILKVKRDFYDPYVWVLAQNNEVYRINSLTKTVDNYTSKFAAFNGSTFIDIAGRSADTVFVATSIPTSSPGKKALLRLSAPLISWAILIP
jgi:hypothetical protein